MLIAPEFYWVLSLLLRIAGNAKDNLPPGEKLKRLSHANKLPRSFNRSQLLDWLMIEIEWDNNFLSLFHHLPHRKRTHQKKIGTNALTHFFLPSNLANEPVKLFFSSHYSLQPKSLALRLFKYFFFLFLLLM